MGGLQKKGLNTGKKKGSDRLTGYAMIAPFFILLMLFVIVPIVINVILSFMNYNMYVHSLCNIYGGGSYDLAVDV